MAIRVLLVEDHAVVREGTREVLARDPDLAVVGEAGDGQQAIDLARELKPDVAIVDLRLPVLSGIEALREIRAAVPATKILVLTAYDDDHYVLAAMQAGASGYLLKTARGDEVIKAVHAVNRGEVVLEPTIAARAWRSAAGGGPEASLSDLTKREVEILRLAARGLRNKEIAQELQVSVRTVDEHLSNIYGKLGVSSKTEAIVYGTSRGWFSFD